MSSIHLDMYSVTSMNYLQIHFSIRAIAAPPISIAPSTGHLAQYMTTWPSAAVWEFAIEKLSLNTKRIESVINGE
jgi:hypothetical protein